MSVGGVSCDENLKSVLCSRILYNFDCPGTNQTALNLFTWDKSMKIFPWLRSRDFSQGDGSAWNHYLPVHEGTISQDV